MEFTQVCRTCLIKNVKMYNMQSISKLTTFWELTGILVCAQNTDVGMYPFICYECLARLRKFEDFRSNCLRAHEILTHKVTTYLHRTSEEECFISPLKLSAVLSFECIDSKQSNDLVILNPKEINIKRNNKQCKVQYNMQDVKKYECCKNNQQDDDTGDKKITGFADSHRIVCSKISDIGHSIPILSVIGHNEHDMHDVMKYEFSQNNKVVTNAGNDVISTEFVSEDSIVSNNSSGIEHNEEKVLDVTNNEVSRNDEFIANTVINKMSTECTTENSILHSPDVAIALNIEGVPLKTKKRKVVRGKRVCPYVNDERFSNLQTGKIPLVKSNGPVNKKLKLDAKSFDEFATVTIMTIQEAKEEVELRKESSNFKNCPFKCNFCYRGYDTQKTYSNHMKKHNTAYGKHECEICHLRFPKRYLCTKHKLNCHKRKFSCLICPYICFGKSQAILHINLHKGVMYTCEMCQETFSMPNTLLMHKRFKHPTEVVCALCGSTFANDKGLQLHNWKVHKQETNDKKGPQCIECDIHFATETAWKRHLVLSAKHKVSNGCETCGETFPSNDMLKSHAKSHTRMQRPRFKVSTFPAACPICKILLTNISEFKVHMKSHHPNVTKQFQIDKQLPCVCEFCGKIYKKRCLLAYHQRKHTGERPYTCDVCQKSFSYPATLYAHKRTHITVSKVKCDMCDKVYRFKNALIKHIKLNHLNIRPHSCDVCGKSYHNLCEVKYHKQHVHGNVPWPKRDRSKRNKPHERSDSIK